MPLWQQSVYYRWDHLFALGPQPNTQAISSLYSGTLEDRQDVTGHDDYDVVVWLSDDGLTWTEAAFELEGQQVAGAITTYGEEIVVVGFDLERKTNIISYSTNGKDWETLTAPAFSNADALPMVAYTHDNQIIILGADLTPLVGRP